jgi:hypothetical protein
MIEDEDKRDEADLPPASAPQGSGHAEASPSTPESILEVGSEGGSAALCRELCEDGSYDYHVVTNEVALYDFLDDADRAGLGPPIRRSSARSTFDEALAVLDKDCWARLYPVVVHPEFADRIWEALLLRIEIDQSRHLWKWSHLCNKELIDGVWTSAMEDADSRG